MELLEGFRDNIPSLVVVAVIVLGGALINNGYLSKLFKKRGMSQPVADIVKRVDEIESRFTPNLDDILARIENKLDSLSDRVSDVEKRLNYVDKSALMGVIYNSSIHTIDRLRAFHTYLCLDGNGLVAEYAVKELVIPNRDDWIRAWQESKMRVYCDKDKYDERIAEINRKIAQAEGAKG